MNMSDSDKAKVINRSHLIICVVALTMFNWLRGYFLSLYDTGPLPIYPEITIEKLRYVWKESPLGGRNYVGLGLLVYYLFIYLLSFVLPSGLANSLLFTILFAISGLAMYKFTLETLGYRLKYRRTAALISALSYMFNTYIVIRLPLFMPVYFTIALLPLCLLYLRRAFYADTCIDFLYHVILASLITIFMSPAFCANFPIAQATTIFIILYLVFLSIVKRRIRKVIPVITSFMLLTFINNMWWLIPAFTQSAVQACIKGKPEWIRDALGVLEHASKYATYFNVLRCMPYNIDKEAMLESAYYFWTPLSELYNTPGFVAISILPPILSLLAILLKTTREQSDAMAFTLIFCIFVPLLGALNPPFGIVVRWLVENIPGYALRRVYNFIFILHFIYSYLLSLGMIDLGELLGKTLNSLARTVPPQRVVSLAQKSLYVCLMIALCGIYIFPLWLGYSPIVNVYDERGNLLHLSTLTRPPEYVEELCKYLNSLPEKGDVLILPMCGIVRTYLWEHGHFGEEIYFSMLKRSTSFATSPGYFMYDVYRIIHEIIHKSSALNLGNLLSFLGIKYIIVAEDAGLSPLAPRFNTTRIENFLSTQKDIRLIRRFGKHLLYEVLRTPQEKFYVATNVVIPSFEKPYIRGTIYSLRDYHSISNNIEDLYIRSNYLSVNFSIQWLNVTFNYNEKVRRDKWYPALLHTKLPLNITTDAGRFLAVTLKTDPNIGLCIFIKKKTSDYSYSLIPLIPLNPTNETCLERGIIVSSARFYTFVFNIEFVDRVDYLVLGLTPIDPQCVGNYSVYVRNIQFAYYAAVSPDDFLAMLPYMDNVPPVVFAEKGDYGNISRLINLTQIPRIIVKKRDPTEFYIKVINPSAPFILASTIAYEENWVAKIDGNELKHIKINGFFNGWFVDHIGNSFTIKVYYKGQILANICAFTSMIFMTIECCLLVITIILQKFSSFRTKKKERIIVQRVAKDFYRGSFNDHCGDSMRILITGGAGMQGSRLVRKILKVYDADVIVIDNLSRGSLTNLKDILSDIEFRQVDLRSPGDSLSIMQDVDMVFHLAAHVGGVEYVHGSASMPGHGATIASDNLLIDVNVLKACVKYGVERMLYASTACVYPVELQKVPDAPPLREEYAFPANAESPYGWAKLMGEILCKSYAEEFGLKVAIVRLFNVYGEGEPFERGSHVIPELIRKAIMYPKEPFIVYGDGSQTRSFLYVDDAVEALILAIEKYPVADPINIGSEERISIKDLAMKIITISGKDISPVFDPSKPVGVVGRCPDITKAKRVLQWHPKVPLDVGLRRVYTWIYNRISEAD